MDQNNLVDDSENEERMNEGPQKLISLYFTPGKNLIQTQLLHSQLRGYQNYIHMLKTIHDISHQPLEKDS